MKPALQIVYDIDKKKIVAQLGNPKIFPKPGGDISLSPDGNWLVNGYSKNKKKPKDVKKPKDDKKDDKRPGKNYYAVYRISDGAYVRSEGINKGLYSGDIRIDGAPRWNRTNDAILVPGLAKNGTRQMFILHVNAPAE